MEYTDKRRICVRGIIYKDGKLFCQELKDKQGNPRGFWCTPGGGLNALESLTDGAAREILEETGVPARVGKLLFVQSYGEAGPGPHGELEQLEFFFHIENPSDFENINEQASHFDAEISHYGFIDPKTTNLLPNFLRTINIQDHITNDRPVYIYNNFN